ELSTARVLPEPLAPVSGSATPGENDALAKALVAFKSRKDAEDVSVLEKFLASYPRSRWRPCLELDIGLNRFDYGYISEDLKLWESSWAKAKTETGATQKAVANRALGELILLHGRLGHMEELKRYLDEASKRRVTGSVEEQVAEGRQGLWCMEHRPEVSFR